MAVKEQGEQDQLDSEKIGFFKANKDRIREELTQVKKVLDDEKLSLQDDRIKLRVEVQRKGDRSYEVRIYKGNIW